MIGGFCAANCCITLGYNPGKADKLTRLHLMSPIFKAGFVWMVESDRYPGQKRFRSWAEPVVQQICGFSGPNSILRDDLLDTTTQAMRFMNDLWLQYLPPQDVKEAERKRMLTEIQRVSRSENPYTV